MTNIYYDNHYVGTRTDFDTTRKSRDIAEYIQGYPNSNISIIEPSAISLRNSESLIHSMHDYEYSNALHSGQSRALAESQGFTWDEGIWNMAVHSTAGVLNAIHDAVTTVPSTFGSGENIHGSLSSGLHHARPNYGKGFCTVNGLAVGAYYAHYMLISMNKKVIILDFDAHCGGGTKAFMNEFGMDWVEMFDVSTEPFDSYAPSNNDELIIVDREADYLPTIADLLQRIDFDDCGLVLYNAGVDPYPRIGFDTLAEREQMVFDYLRDSGIPTAFVLAGGYTIGGYSRESLTQAHMNTIYAAAGMESVSNPDLTMSF